jgi:hypothetical protein
MWQNKIHTNIMRLIPMHEEEQKISIILEALTATTSNKLSQVTIHVSLELTFVSDICHLQHQEMA